MQEKTAQYKPEKTYFHEVEHLGVQHLHSQVIPHKVVAIWCDVALRKPMVYLHPVAVLVPLEGIFPVRP